MNPTETVIATLAGQQDAIWLPWRRIDNRGAIWRARLVFTRAGVPWRSALAFPGGDADDRKAAERALATAVIDGFAGTDNSTGRTSCAKLTDAGETIARELLSMPTIAQSIELVQRIAALPGGYADGWHRETSIAGVAYDQTPQTAMALQELEELALPALARRWLRSNTDTAGRAWYALGEVALGEVALGEHDDGDLDNDFSAEAHEHYLRVRRRELQRLCEPAELRELGDIPMPQGVSDECEP